jgi:endonuclease G
MTRQDQLLAKLRGLNEQIARQDPKLHEESLEARGRSQVLEELASPGTPTLSSTPIQEESIILRRKRPVLAIKNNTTELVFSDQEDSEVWKDRLTRAKDALDKAILSVGRVALEGGRLDWVGTGWLVAENILVTNRHVANEFALRKGEGFTFRMGMLGPIAARTDFLQEIDNLRTLEFKLLRPLHIEEEPGPDVSFFEIETVAGDSKLSQPIELALNVSETNAAATIGYPAYDSRIPDPELMTSLYGNVYDKKRLAPGAITKVEESRLLHNCTTLGGNSGSVVIDLDSGKAIGLHFSGSFLATNYAVRADVVRDLLQRVKSGNARRRGAGETPTPPAPKTPIAAAPKNSGSTSMTIPLTITVSLGNPSIEQARASQFRLPATPAEHETEDFPGEEGRVEDYRDRQGYLPDFIGKRFSVPLPSIERGTNDVLEFNNDGETDTILRYEHYSVVMSRSRRMCFFSAVNIDGNLSRKSARVAWKWDPRIPKEQQIMNECYGTPPKFSRGHMTRREDPGWGDAKTAKRGNEDSMHVTNTTPQMQAFNAPIWLALEDYALQHAREDEMKISVFTGPYFGKRDPIMYGVKIPLRFWKIIAFIHDETGKLCATGYEMDQKQTLQPEEEFVFGDFTSPQLGIATQVPIRSIEERSGLSFGQLTNDDPLAGEEEGVDGGAARVPLLSFEQIRFVQ